MTIKIEPFKGKIQDLQSGRGRAKSKETLEIEKQLISSANSGEPFVVSSPDIELDSLKARVRSTGGALKLGVSIRQLDGRLVVQATFRDGSGSATISTPAEPEFVEAAPAPRPRRRTSKRS